MTEAQLLKPFGPTKNRYLVFCRAGDDSLHGEWMHPSEHKNFDLFVEYYGDDHGRFIHDCDYYAEAKGVKWERIGKLVQQYEDFFYRYDAVWFPDDDILTDSRNIQELFSIFTKHRLTLAQAALTEDSYPGWPTECVQREYVLRYTNFVHCMAPLFSREALRIYAPTFGLSSTGWGLDYVWPQLLNSPEHKIAVIHETPVTHTRPVGEGTIRDDCKELGIDPGTEFESLGAFFNLDYYPEEYGGILKSRPPFPGS